MTNHAVSNRADLRECTKTMSRHGDRRGQIDDFLGSFETINWLYLLFKCGIKTKTHFEWLLWHWSSLGQLNLEPSWRSVSKKPRTWVFIILFHLYGNKGVSWPIRPQWFNTFIPCAEPFRDGHEGMWVRFGSQGSITLNWHSRYSGTWLYIVNLILRNKLQWNLNQNSYIFMHENVLENIFWKMAAILSRPQHCSVPSICDLFCTLSLLSLHCVPTEQCHSSSCLVVTSGTLMIL